MKSWFTKLSISNGIDARKPLPLALQQTIARSEELRSFERETLALDCGLKGGPPLAAVIPSLHDSIMEAVRTERKLPSKEKTHRFQWVRWLPAPALAAVIAGGILWNTRPQGQPPSAATAELSGAISATFDLSDEMARSMPSVIIAPLTKELQLMNQDLESTAEFLLASLP
jgi:hypothetical protein